MVIKNRIKVMLIYIFLAIYISIGTVNVYAASGDFPVNNSNANTNGGTPSVSVDESGNLSIKMDDDKSHESQQLGNCDGQDYAMGSITIPSLEINPIVVSNTKTWGQSEFETWLRNEIFFS